MQHSCEVLACRTLLHGLQNCHSPKRCPNLDRITKPYAVLFVGGSWEGKVWPARNFGGNCASVLHECGINVVLAGGPLFDRVQAIKVLDCLNGSAIDLTEKTSLSELAELLRNACGGSEQRYKVQCTLGRQSARQCCAFWVAATTAGSCRTSLEKQEPSRPTPIVVVQPMSCFGCNWQCIHPRERGESCGKCVSDISVEQVWRHFGGGITRRPLKSISIRIPVNISIPS